VLEDAVSDTFFELSPRSGKELKEGGKEEKEGGTGIERHTRESSEHAKRSVRPRDQIIHRYIT
jgi:hypothetical protein